jgi:two-component system response regulator NreC
MRFPVDRIRILVVDDHTIMRDGIRALLSLHDDIEVVGEASEGKEALEKAQELLPDVVIMDIAMSGMDGLEATRRIRKKHPKMKVLVLTQHDNKEYILSVIKAGASGYVPKRALGSELVSAIRAVQQGDSFLYPSAAAALIEDYLQQAREEEEPYDQLTAREREILKLIAEGRTSREIADILFISLKTVLGHRSKIMEKLNLHNRTELIKYALRKGLVSLDT